MLRMGYLATVLALALQQAQAQPLGSDLNDAGKLCDDSCAFAGNGKFGQAHKINFFGKSDFLLVQRPSS